MIVVKNYVLQRVLTLSANVFHSQDSFSKIAFSSPKCAVQLTFQGSSGKGYCM